MVAHTLNSQSTQRHRQADLLSSNPLSFEFQDGHGYTEKKKSKPKPNRTTTQPQTPHNSNITCLGIGCVGLCLSTQEAEACDLSEVKSSPSQTSKAYAVQPVTK